MLIFATLMDRRRILVAEEDGERLESLAWLFIKEGFRVIGVDNGFDALKQMLLERPDLVVVDLDGDSSAASARDVIARMQEEDTLRAIPTVVLSASLADQRPARGTVTLLKPCSHGLLLATAERLLLPDPRDPVLRPRRDDSVAAWFEDPDGKVYSIVNGG